MTLKRRDAVRQHGVGGNFLRISHTLHPVRLGAQAPALRGGKGGEAHGPRA